MAQGKRPIPIQLKDAVQKKLQYMKENKLIEGPLPPGECKGWIHNMVITKKSWSIEEVRINIDTKRMNDDIVQTKIPIPTTEELRHGLEGSDKFLVLDCRDSFFHFLLDEESQDLFKFHADDGVYRFLVLVMGTPLASGECHAAMSYRLDSLDGVIVIKDDIVVHGKGAEHDANLDAFLQRLYDYGIRLRREKCKMGKQAVMWFGHIYSKQGMSADPAKVEHIKNHVQDNKPTWKAVHHMTNSPTISQRTKGRRSKSRQRKKTWKSGSGTPCGWCCRPLHRIRCGRQPGKIQNSAPYWRKRRPEGKASR